MSITVQYRRLYHRDEQKSQRKKSVILLRGHRGCSTEVAKHESGFEEQVGIYLCEKDGASFLAEERTRIKA